MRCPWEQGGRVEWQEPPEISFSEVTVWRLEWEGIWVSLLLAWCPPFECLAGRQAPFPPQYCQSNMKVRQRETNESSSGKGGYHGNKQAGLLFGSRPNLSPPSQCWKMGIVQLTCILGVGTIIPFWQFLVTLEWAALHFNLINRSHSFLRSARNMAFSGSVPGRILVATEGSLGLLFISQ